MTHLEQQDPEIYRLIKAEELRQYNTIRLIASENYTSSAVMEACGSVLTNKYSEGYPGKRYYEGQEIIDQVENLAIRRAKEVFQAEHANVQALSGSPANMALYLAFLQLGDKIMGLSLPHGGHLTHGWSASFSGQLYQAVPYFVNKDTQRIDYDHLMDTAKKEKPKLIIAGASAYPRIIDFERFSQIAKEVGAYFIADIAHISGLIAGGVHPSPVPFADAVSSTSHKTLRGPRGGLILSPARHAERIDRAVFPVLQGGPHQHTIAALAVALREASTAEFRAYAQQVVKNARVLADTLLENGFDLVTGGTDTHLILIDLSNKGIAGKLMARAMNKAGLVCNANTVPYDRQGAFNPSGIRVGTAAITSRNMKEAQAQQIGLWMTRIAEHHTNDSQLHAIAAEVKEVCAGFPPLGFPDSLY